MSRKQSKSPYLTWKCAADMESRISKTLFFAEKNCYGSLPSATLTDVAVSMYISAAQSPKRKLEPGYASSLTRKVNVMPCTLMVGILYSERLRHSNPDYLQKISSSDLFVVSMLVASKYLVDDGEDDEIFNDQWAEAGGLAVSTVNRLEREFLDALDWHIFVKLDEFYSLCTTIEISIALKCGLQRGWFSYTDITVFLAAVKYKNMLKAILQNTLKVFMACSLMYGATIAALFSCASVVSAFQTMNTCATATGGDTEAFRHSCGVATSGDMEPFGNRAITRARVQQKCNKLNNGTSNPHLHHLCESCHTENFAADAENKKNHSCFNASHNMQKIHWEPPGKSSKCLDSTWVLNKKISSSFYSWPRCLKGYWATISRKERPGNQFWLSRRKLMSLFETKYLSPIATQMSLSNMNSCSFLSNNIVFIGYDNVFLSQVPAF